MSGTTTNGAMLVRIFTDAGAKPYPVERGQPCTSKVSRLLMPNGNPVVIQTDAKKPRIWLLPRHERGAFSSVGAIVPYKSGQPRHHHLEQVREFVGQAITKVEVNSEHWPDIRQAVADVCSSVRRI